MARESFLSRVIAEFGRALGFADLKLDEQGRRTLYFDDCEVTLTVGAKPTDVLWVHVLITQIRPDDREALIYLLQVGEVLWSKNLMTVGLDQAGELVHGFSMLPAVHVNAERLKALVLEMVRVAVEVNRRVSSRDFPTSGPVVDPGGMIRV
ncbi:MAG: type III secretion system chaperone [Chromatiaceae bacterium]|nr:type III secretion system chaperone [Chromatiaceae bacterium]MCP5315878.1 type III secretion system chaperone [Chromatiaceae bacterium]